MKLHIITPLRKESVNIAWIELNTPAGNFIIQPNHAPTIFTLSYQKKLTYCLRNGKRETLTIRQGIAEITRTTTTLLLNEEE